MILYIPMRGVVRVHAPMIGDKRKLTREVPNFCRRNRTMRMIAERPSTNAASGKQRNCEYREGEMCLHKWDN